MNTLILLSVLLLHPLNDSTPANPRYDFPEQLIAKVRQERPPERFDQLNTCMDVLSIAGHYRESLRYEDSLKGPKAPVRLTLAHKRIIDAKAFILQQAKKHRILLINEAHNHPEHRLFTKSLLKDLHALGYNVLMAEGIRQRNTLEKKKYPVSDDGYYISEPAYASLLRYAMSNGYKVRAYEYASKGYWDDSVKLDQYGSMKYISYEPRDSFTIKIDAKGDRTYYMTGAREKGQAANIVKVLKENPRSKFIIHVGHGHLQEGGAMMGARLRQLLNYEDILTVSQEELDERAVVIDTLTGNTIARDFTYLLWDSTRNRPYHLHNGEGVDYTIFNAKLKDSLGRPGYLFRDLQPRVVYRLLAAQQEDCPCIFSAYLRQEYQKEGAKAIAVDNVYMKEAQRPPLLLYKGDYTIVKKNGAGVYSSFELSVK